MLFVVMLGGKSKQHILRHGAQPHTDGVLDIDDCLPIDLFALFIEWLTRSGAMARS